VGRGSGDRVNCRLSERPEEPRFIHPISRSNDRICLDREKTQTLAHTRSTLPSSSICRSMLSLFSKPSEPTP
jgi:hypothetical protein